MSQKELELRQSLEYNYVMASNLQQGIAIAGDVVKKYDPEGPYKDSEERERQRAEALEIHKDLIEMQLRMLRTIRRQTKKCAPFSGMKDLKFGDMEDAEEV